MSRVRPTISSRRRLLRSRSAARFAASSAARGVIVTISASTGKCVAVTTQLFQRPFEQPGWAVDPAPHLPRRDARHGEETQRDQQAGEHAMRVPQGDDDGDGTEQQAERTEKQRHEAPDEYSRYPLDLGRQFRRDEFEAYMDERQDLREQLPD
jgi:hypothetical protein